MGNPSQLSHIVPALILVAVLSASPSWAMGGPPMITDDTATPGDGHWEVNVAALSNHVAGATTYQLPLVDANFGIGDRLQFKYEMPWLLQVPASGNSLGGAGDGLAGVRWRFYDAGENDWQVSTYPQVVFNFPLLSSAHNGLADSGASYLLPFQFVRGFDGFDINFELGRWFRPALRQRDSWIAGFVLTREVRKGFELMAELYEETAVRQSQDELILNFGVRYDFSGHYTLLAAAGRDLRNTLGQMNTLMTYLGLQFRF